MKLSESSLLRVLGGSESGFIVRAQRGGGFQVNIVLREYVGQDRAKITKLDEAAKLLAAAGIHAELSLSRPKSGGGFTPWPCMMVEGPSASAGSEKAAEVAQLQLLVAALKAGASSEVIAAMEAIRGTTEPETASADVAEPDETDAF
jgi:hypothetical protein